MSDMVLGTTRSSSASRTNRGLRGFRGASVRLLNRSRAFFRKGNMAELLVRMVVQPADPPRLPRRQALYTCTCAPGHFRDRCAENFLPAAQVRAGTVISPQLNDRRESAAQGGTGGNGS